MSKTGPLTVEQFSEKKESIAATYQQISVLPIDPAIEQYAKDKIVKSLPGAVEATKAKLKELKKYAMDGDWTWKFAALVASSLTGFVNLTGFISNVFGFSLTNAVLNLYLLLFAATSVILEYKHLLLPDKYIRIVAREAHLLVTPYGRAAFYFLIGLTQMNIGGFLGFVAGVLSSAVGVIIFFASRSAYKALLALKTDPYTVADIRKKFSEADADNSGAIDSHELPSLCNALGFRLNKNELESLMLILDKDRNGTVTFAEFMDWWTTHEDESLFD